MPTLAIHGGKPAVTSRIEPYNMIWSEEALAAFEVVKRKFGSLSGYLGGEPRGGPMVCRLEELWADTFGVRHAIACNSATSGLLAACMAVGVDAQTDVLVSPYTMSATAAAPKLLGGNVRFGDIDEQTFCLEPREADVIIPTNLFGHPSPVHQMSEKFPHSIIIEDNAQAIFATENGDYAGTIGDIGVFSLNVHKQLQCGEGGICVTDDDDLADSLRGAVNHGEMAGGQVGLNLRMTEVSAAIALTQLLHSAQIIADRILIAKVLIGAVSGLPGIRAPIIRTDCTSTFYCVPFLIEGDRDWFVQAMRAEGVPLRAGYVKPLYRLPAFMTCGSHVTCPVTESVEQRMVLWENCSHSPTTQQLQQICDAFEKVAAFRRH